MTDFLLELLSEEIPARMQEKASADLARLFDAEIAKAGLKARAIESFVTPRRLALIARDLPAATEAVSEELKGPRADAPAQAIAGFLGKTGLAREQLVERADAKGNAILFAVIEKPGRPTADVLAEAIPAIVRAFPWPKAMRWGAASISTESPRWVRPLQGVVALFGEDVVPFEIAGIASCAATVGHRFHHPGVITIGSARDHIEKLEACHVIVDSAERRRMIREGAERAATAAGLTLVPDEGLVAENAGLTEWPVPLLGTFDPAFLAVPREVIQLTMRTNQKYFACTDARGALAPAFVCTANISPVDGGAGIVAGNAKVLAARLADARFFWEQDLRVPLAESAKKLAGIVFHERLGTVADKVERVAKLARWLVEEGIVKPSPLQGRGLGEGESGETGAEIASSAVPHSPTLSPEGEREMLADMAEQAARLCKADLVTGMVGEFPELQGVMGGYYARHQGLPDAVADAIRDHYKPVGQGDDVPTAPVTVAVSLADKLDTIFAFFSIEQGPTGSRDPFALRRQMLGVLSIITRNDLRVSLCKVFESISVIHHEQYVEAMAIDVAGLDDLLEGYYSKKLQKDRAAFDLLESLVQEARETFLASVPERSVDPDDPFVRGNQERRLGAMFRAYTAWHRWFLDWDDATSCIPATLNFAHDRLKVQQREAGVRHDLIDAVFALGGEDDLVRLLARVKALQAFVETADGANLLAGYRRAANILKKEGFDPLRHPGEGRGPEPRAAAPAALDAGLRRHDGEEVEGGFVFSYDPDRAEAALADALATQLPQAEAAIAHEQFEEAMTALSVMRPAIDRFFEEVTVNSQDGTKRLTRLALLDKLRAAMHNVADFSRIEG